MKKTKDTGVARAWLGRSTVHWLLLAALCLSQGAQAQLLMSDGFNGYSNGSLSGQGSWVGLNASSLAFQVDDATAVTYGCYSDGGRNAGPAAGSMPYNQRLRYPTTAWVASVDMAFYSAFAIRLSAAGSDPMPMCSDWAVTSEASSMSSCVCMCAALAPA